MLMTPWSSLLQRYHLKDQIRRRIKKRRALLSSSTITQQSLRLCQRLRTLPVLAQASRVGFYMPFKGEIDPCFYVRSVWGFHKRFYLPILLANGKLSFAHVDKQSVLKKNTFGILEPQPPFQISPAYALDVLLCPLVAFDLMGNRLGMGAGFYDKTLSFKRTANQKPLLIGLAYDFQEQHYIPHHSRDIPLNYCVTPSRLICF